MAKYFKANRAAFDNQIKTVESLIEKYSLVLDYIGDYERAADEESKNWETLYWEKHARKIPKAAFVTREYRIDPETNRRARDQYGNYIIDETYDEDGHRAAQTEEDNAAKAWVRTMRNHYLQWKGNYKGKAATVLDKLNKLKMALEKINAGMDDVELLDPDMAQALKDYKRDLYYDAQDNYGDGDEYYEQYNKAQNLDFEPDENGRKLCINIDIHLTSS